MSTTTIDERKGTTMASTPEIITDQKLQPSQEQPQEQTSLVITPMTMLHAASKRGASIEELTQWMNLYERWDKAEARKAYVDAMAAFKSHAIQVVKDKFNKQYDSKYVSIGRLVATVTPYLSQHGLSANWDIDQSTPGVIKTTCIITHKAGHSESVSMICPPDKSGAKNPIQEIKSAITYGKACTFESICGLASTDANLDDDGNGSGGGSSSPDGQFDYHELQERIEHFANCLNAKEVTDHFAASWDEIYKSGDLEAQRAIVKAKDSRLKELKKGVAR